MWPISTVLRDLERRAAVGAGVAGSHLAQVVELGLKVLAGRDIAQVVIVAIRAGDHVAPAGERRVGEHRACCVTPTGPSEPASAPNHSRISRGMRRAELGVAGDGGELGLAELMVAAQQDQHGLAVGDQHEALHLRGLGQARELGDLGDGLAAGRVELLGREVALGIGRGGADGARDTAFSRFAA